MIVYNIIVVDNSIFQNYEKMNSMLLFCLINRHLSSFEMRSHINENILKVYTKTLYVLSTFLK